MAKLRPATVGVVLACAALAAAAPIQPQQPPPEEPEHVHTRPARPLRTPDINSALLGAHVRLPDPAQVFLDPQLYDVAATQVALRNLDTGVASAPCAVGLAAPDFVEFSPADCGGSAVFDGVSTRYAIDVVAVALDLGRPVQWSQEFEYFVIEQKPWVLENERGVWPPSEVNLNGNIMENFQDFGLTPYWHQGLDIRSFLETRGLSQTMYSPVDGRVVQKVNYSGGSPLYWSVMVQDEQGFVWQAHHLDIDTVTLEIGDPVSVGTVLGNIAVWPATWNGLLYHHVHLNVVRPHPDWTEIPLPYVDGWRYFNPLLFFTPGNYTNDEAPFVGDMFFLDNESNTAFASSTDTDTPVLSGAVDVVLELGSLYSASANDNVGGQPYQQALYAIELRVTDASGALVHKSLVADFDRLPGAWPYVYPDFPVREADEVLLYVFKQSFSYLGQTLRSIFNYNQRVFYYTLTNWVRGQPDPAGAWDTTAVPDGPYVVTVEASDYWGKSVAVSVDVVVSN